MIIDHRTYTIRPGQMAAYLEIYREHGYPLQRKHLGEPLGWYTSTDIGALNQIVHLWGYQDHADRTARRAALATEAGWKIFLERGMPLVQTMENKILVQPGFIGA